MTKVMLVEDDLTMVGLLRTFLEIEGFQVAAFSPGEDILESIQENDPEVILLDVHLKNIGDIDIDGFDVLTQIRKDDRLHHIKVIMSSGLDVREKSNEAGADVFMLKPYMPNDLIQRIKQVLD